jgi:folate-binding protein YgfZ
MPATQLEDCLARLRMFVLRAKVALDASGMPLAAQWTESEDGMPDAAFAAGPTGDGLHAIRLPGSAARWLILGAQAEAPDDGRWHFEDVCSALPQVYPATREQFLPQSLNLDALDGISFEKGCYVGQEVIARLHFRGKVKRRMGLFDLPGDAELPRPGAELVADGKAVGRVVDAARHEDRSAVLAVCPVAAGQEDLQTADGAPLTPRALPYPLPSS